MFLKDYLQYEKQKRRETQRIGKAGKQRSWKSREKQRSTEAERQHSGEAEKRRSREAKKSRNRESKNCKNKQQGNAEKQKAEKERSRETEIPQKCPKRKNSNSPQKITLHIHRGRGPHRDVAVVGGALELFGHVTEETWGRLELLDLMWIPMRMSINYDVNYYILLYRYGILIQ